MAQEQEPIVRIRDLKKDRVNFVLENVDMSYVGLLFPYVQYSDRCAVLQIPSVV